MNLRGTQFGSDGKASACSAGDLGSIPGWEAPLEKEMATHSSTLAWEIPWTEDPDIAESDRTERLNFQFPICPRHEVITTRDHREVSGTLGTVYWPTDVGALCMVVLLL